MAVMHRRYRPSKFTIGYYTSSCNSSYSSSSNEKLKFGWPSCKWLKDGKWTEISTFNRLTQGVKPHTQRDAETQLKKDIGISIDEISNEPISGFEVVAVNHGYRSGESYVAVKDPRGFCVALDPRWLERAVLKYHCSVSESGEVSGKWFYCWDHEKFAGIKHESELSTVDADDNILEAEMTKLRSFTVDDLKVGKIYDLASKNGDKTNVTRVLYLGEHSIRNWPSMKNILCSSAKFGMTEIARRWKAISSIFPGSSEIDMADWLPWNDATYVRKAELALKEKKPTLVFISLIDNISSYQSTYSDGTVAEWYADDLAGVIKEDQEHSICFRFDPDDQQILTGKEIVKRLVKESDDQSVRIVSSEIPYGRRSSRTEARFKFVNPAKYRVMKFEDILKAFKKFMRIADDRLAYHLKLIPSEAPADFAAWKNFVREWKHTKWDPCHKDSYYRW